MAENCSGSCIPWEICEVIGEKDLHSLSLTHNYNVAHLHINMYALHTNSHMHKEKAQSLLHVDDFFFFVSQGTNIAKSYEANYIINCGFMFPSLSQQSFKGCVKISTTFHGWASQNSHLVQCMSFCSLIENRWLQCFLSSRHPNTHFLFVNSKNTKDFKCAIDLCAVTKTPFCRWGQF